MAGKGKALGAMAKLAVKYGPHAVAVGRTVGPAVRDSAERIVASQRERKVALAQASTLLDGSVLKVIRGDQTYWVVYSGDQVIETHPLVAPGELDALLARVDLTRRIRPGEQSSRRGGLRQRLPGRRTR